MKSTITCLFIFLSLSLFAQQDYFQQEVNYKIDVSLDDEAHILTGMMTVEYINHSPNIIDSIYFHLWANAYKNNETAFAKQQVRMGKTKFFFANQSDKGGYTAIDFKNEANTSLKWNTVDNMEDVVIVKLTKALKPQEKTTLVIPFTIDIPSSFSRFGHVGQSYQMTQWYPKPAVYDKDGWQTMPYLDMGEFYSEYGSFDVKITLPANYVVGATGTLHTEKEKQFIKEKVKETEAWKANYNAEETTANDDFPESSENKKTIHYSAENVHDFAWFADKRFKVLSDQVDLASGKKVDTYVMFTNFEADLWKDAVLYVSRSVKYYSDHVGEYPYPHATAVQSALSAGAGMEYPMITVIGESGSGLMLDKVIAHEVGHNWFYGIIGTNERIHPWMDEGMNSYYEERYIEEYYGNDGVTLEKVGVPSFLVNNTPYSINQVAHLFQVCNHRTQPPDMDSDKMSQINYWTGAYSKPAFGLRQMEGALGREQLDQAMHAYFQKWKYKHPTPEDFTKAINESANTDISWFVEGFMKSTEQQDYTIKNVKDKGDNYEITIKNKGRVDAPFPIQGVANDTMIVQTKWLKGHQGEQQITLPKADFDKIVIDAEYQTLDADHRNNFSKIKGLMARPFGFKLLGGLENPEKVYAAVLPVITYNAYNKLSYGLALHNWRLPERKFTYLIAPTYNSKTNALNGLAHFSYRTALSTSRTEMSKWVEIGLSANKFHASQPSVVVEKIKPYVHFLFENIAENKNTDIKFTSYVVGNEGLVSSVTNRWKTCHEISLIHNNNNVLNPWSIGLTVESGKYRAFFDVHNYVLPKLEVKYAYAYKAKKYLRFRLFTGMVFSKFRERGSLRGLLNLTGQGYSANNDYKYEDWYFGRNDYEGIWSQQISLREGGFKTALPITQAVNGFTSNKMLVSLNISGDLPVTFPLKLPIRPYFDVAYVDTTVDRNANGVIDAEENKTFQEQLWWSGGLSLQFGEIVGIYFPLVNSKSIERFDSDYRAGGYFNRVSFMFNLQNLNPKKIAQELKM